MKLNICHLYPDLLNLYGDQGNIICMKKRLEWRHIDVTVTLCGAGDPLNAGDYDLFFIGGGQDFEQEVLLDDLKGAKARAVKSAIEDGKTMLAICGGYQMLGHYYKTWDGKQMDYLGALDLYTEGHPERMIGNYVYTFADDPSVKVVGFENHSGKTYLGSSVSPMGTVLKGYGNNGEDGTEGARYKNVFATYSHGALLPKNPKVCDSILKTALEYKYGHAELSPLDDAAETAAHDAMLGRLL